MKLIMKKIAIFICLVMLFTAGCKQQGKQDVPDVSSPKSSVSSNSSPNSSDVTVSGDTSSSQSEESSSDNTSDTISDSSSETVTSSVRPISVSAKTAKILSKYTKSYLSLDSYDLDRYMLPYWDGNLVFNEQVLMVKNENGVAEAPLLYKPLKILSVRDATLKIEYKEGVDWEVKNGRLRVIDSGSIIPMDYEEFYPNRYNASASAHRYINGVLTDKFIRVGAGTYFQPQYLNVTYLHEDQWDGQKPQYKGNLLPKTMAKLKAGQKTNIVIYGDSISHGDESTGYYNIEPYMPLWSEMSQGILKEKYGDNVSVTNLSVGGWSSSNGVNGGYECYLQKYVPGAKERVGGLKPDLVVIGFGHNDGDLPMDRLKMNIQKIMNLIHSVSPDTEFIILGVMYPNPETSASDVPSYRFYKNQYKCDATLASFEKTGVAFMPIKVYEDMLYRHKRPQDLHANNINHPNDFLYRFYAQYLCKTLIEDF